MKDACGVQSIMINQRLDKLEDLVARAYDQLDVLCDRLSPVCIPPQLQMQMQQQTDGPAEPGRPMSLLAQNIQRHTDTLRSLCNKMNHLLDSLEV